MLKLMKKNWYFINPAIVFNGDRARFVSEIVKKKEVMEKQPESIASTDRKNKNKTKRKIK